MRTLSSLFVLLTLLSFTTESRAQDCPNDTRPGIHVVQRGETLWGISRKYDMSVDEIVAANQMDVGKTLRRCDELRVRKPGEGKLTEPAPVAVPDAVREETIVAPAPVPSFSGPYHQRLETSGGVHRVQKGETVFSIAKYYGYTVDRLREMNGLTPENIIQPGQNLIVSACFFQNGGSIGIN